MQIFIARHGETEWNARGLIQGHAPTRLNENGIANAQAIAEALQGKGVSTIYSSDIQRAAQTAHIIAAVLGNPVVEDPRLRECAFGRLEGMTIDEYEKECLALCGDTMKTSARYDFHPFGGESRNDVLSRHLSFLEDLRKNYAATPLIIGHGRSLSTLMNELRFPFPDLSFGHFGTLDIE